MRVRNADLGISAITRLAGDHVRRHTRDIGAVSEDEGVVHHLDVLFVRFWNAGRHGHSACRRRPRFGGSLLKSAFGLSNALEIMVYGIAIFRAHFSLEI